MRTNYNAEEHILQGNKPYTLYYGMLRKSNIMQMFSIPDIIFTVPLITNEYQDPQRVRRSERPGGGTDKYIHITLPTPSSDIVLRLFTSESLFLDGATFEVRQGNVSTGTPLRRDCYYQGKVLSKNDSYAALSICSGLVSSTYYISFPIITYTCNYYYLRLSYHK